MTDQARIERAAEALWAAQRAPWAPLPTDLMPRDLDEAWRVGEAFRARLAAVRGAQAGWKIALTTPTMRELMGVDRSLPGAIFARTVHRSPARVPAADFVRVGIECEIAIRLGRDLADIGAPYTAGAVGDAVVAVAPAFELIEDRAAQDYVAVGAAMLLAENCWNGGIVLGPERTDWRGLDLAAIEGSLTMGGRAIGRGKGGDAMGHPLAALAWLANELIARGRMLKAGDIVMTGSIVPTKFPGIGEACVFRAEGLGEAAMALL